MEFPILLLNFKSYQEASGKKAVELARVAHSVCSKAGVKVAVCVGAADLQNVSKEVLTYAQHIDSAEYGAHTGSIIAEAVREAGGAGTLINHSERRLTLADIGKTVERCRQAKLASVVCAKDPDEAEKVARLGPDMVAVEPPELISGDVSVTSAKPEVITAALAAVGNTPLLCGAGVKTAADVAKAIELGCKGVLIASGYVKAWDHEKYLKELVKGFS